MEFVSTEVRLPKPNDIDEVCNPYYTVKLKNGYHNHQAMYLKNKNGKCGWYTSYIEKLIVPVTFWLDESRGK